MDLRAISAAYQKLQEPPLDDSQRHFCSLADKYIRLLAPAGSGKTYSLLHRCRFILKNRAHPKPRFLIFTFTRAAKDELMKRLATDPWFQPLASATKISTLNSYGFKVLQKNAFKAKLITKSNEKHILVQHNLQPVWKKHERVANALKHSGSSVRILDLIDYMKSLGFRHDQVTTTVSFHQHIDNLISWNLRPHVKRLFVDLRDLHILQSPQTEEFNAVIAEAHEHFARFWADACAMMKEMSLFTLEDQKYWARLFLEDSASTSSSGADLVKYTDVLVDEFQDINPLDLCLLKAIVQVADASLTIVGDDDQAIYEWRSATPEFILNPETHFGKSFASCVLSKNYRCPQNIVEMSQRLIKHNARRVDKTVAPVSKRYAKVETCKFSSTADTYNEVLCRVLTLLNRQQADSVALIGRKRSQIVPYQIVCASRDIEFCAAEDLNVFLSSAFGDLIDMIAIRGRARRPSEWDSDPVEDILKLCNKVMKYPLSKKDSDALRRHLNAHRPNNYFEGVRALRDYRGELKGPNPLGNMSNTFASALRAFFSANTVSDALRAISVNFYGLQKDYGKAQEDIFYTDPPFIHLSDYARRYKDDFDGFLRDIRKAKDALENYDDASETDPDAAVSAVWERPIHLMTALRAKGKEFDAVVVLDANDGIWPSCLAETVDEREQERRLFYVAVTRAMKYLYFVVNERIGDKVVAPTPFLAEMGVGV